MLVTAQIVKAEEGMGIPLMQFSPRSHHSWFPEGPLYMPWR